MTRQSPRIGLPDDASPGRLPDELFDGQQALTSEVDAATAAVFRAYPDELACRAGCASCCHSYFDIGLLDGFRVLRGLAALPPGVRAGIVAHATEALRRTAIALQRCEPYEGVLGRFVNETDAEEAGGSKGVPCPLLDEAGACSVYAWRPLVCRYHGLPRWHPAAPDQLDYCYLNFRGLRARGEQPDGDLALDVAGYRDRAEALEQEFAGRVFGVPALRYVAPVEEFVAAAGRSLAEWERFLAPLADRVFVAVRRFFEGHGIRDEARHLSQDPNAGERSAAWAEDHLGAPDVAADFDRVVNACLDSLAGDPVDAAAVSAILRNRGYGFRRHAQLVSLQVVRDAVG